MVFGFKWVQMTRVETSTELTRENVDISNEQVIEEEACYCYSPQEQKIEISVKSMKRTRSSSCVNLKFNGK